MRTALISIFVLIAGAACGLALPDSREPVLTDANLLTGFLRVTPTTKYRRHYRPKPGSGRTAATSWCTLKPRSTALLPRALSP